VCMRHVSTSVADWSALLRLRRRNDRFKILGLSGQRISRCRPGSILDQEYCSVTNSLEHAYQVPKKCFPYTQLKFVHEIHHEDDKRAQPELGQTHRERIFCHRLARGEVKRKQRGHTVVGQRLLFRSRPTRSLSTT
jgi:hypothetical protein